VKRELVRIPGPRAMLLLAALAVPCLPAAALALEPFDVVLSPGDSESFLSVTGTTRVLVEGGHASFLDVLGTASLQMTSGTISHLDVRDSASAVIAGGAISHIDLTHSATAVVSGGVHSHFRADDVSIAVLTGSRIDHVTAFKGSRIDIRAGTFGFATAAGADPFAPSPLGPSTINVFGGSVGTVRTQNGGVAHIYGGDVGGINPFDGVTNVYGGTLRSAILNPGTTINAYGRDFDLERTGSVFGSPQYRWTGVLRDGTPLDAELLLPVGAALNLIVIPEPASTLLCLAAVAMVSAAGGRRASRQAAT
jgi:hypothetical protein